MKILIVDDSKTYQAMLAAYIEDMGFHHIVASNGSEALDIFMLEKPDLILMDVNMPGVNGYDSARHIRKLGKGWAEWVPIIFLSSNIEDIDIVKGIEAGGDDYLAKPISEIVLHAKIKAMQRITEHRQKAIELEKSLKKANLELQRQSNTDGLTGIANKRLFNSYLKQEWSRAMRSKSCLSLLFIDVDYFKLYNDHYGHLKGDRCLKRIAATLQKTSHRSVDMACRYGGEEFAIILPDSGYDGMLHMGRAMVQAIRDIKIPHKHSSVADIVTISIGGVTMIPSNGKTCDIIIQHADKCLYQAKKEGRNRLITPPPTAIVTE